MAETSVYFENEILFLCTDRMILLVSFGSYQIGLSG